MKKKWIFWSLSLVGLLLATACKEESVKLTYEDRAMIDTLAIREIAQLTAQYDKWCKDSSLIIRQRMVDSLVVVREQEILRQTLPPQ